MPSSGTRSPGRTRIISPGRTVATGTRASCPSRRTVASVGVTPSRRRTAWRARSRLYVSSNWAKANRKATVAASSHWPMAIAPTTATVISTFMSNRRARIARAALRAAIQPPAPSAAACSTRPSAGPLPSQPATNAAPRQTAEATVESSSGSRHQTTARATRLVSAGVIPSARMASRIVSDPAAAGSHWMRSVRSSRFTCQDTTPGRERSRPSIARTSSWQSISATRTTTTAEAVPGISAR